MSRIYGNLMGEHRDVGIGDDEKVDCEFKVGSDKVPLEFVDVIVTRDKNDYKATMKVHGETDFMLCAEKYDDTFIVKSMVNELKIWLEDSDYEEFFGLLEELKGLKATLCAYLEDIARMEE